MGDDQEIWLQFRATLATALRRKDIKQYELAKAVGVAPSTVHGWLNDQSFPAGDNLVRLAQVLGMQPDQLVPGSGRRAPSGPKARESSERLTGGRLVLDEMEVLLRELRLRWEGQAERAARAEEHHQALEQHRQQKVPRKRQNRG